MNTDSAWTMIREHLQMEMRRLQDEIRSYPAPIPACDAQYNYLLEKRDALSVELSRARELMNQNVSSEGARNAIDDFLVDSNYLGETKKSEIRALIDNDKRSWESEQ